MIEALKRKEKIISVTGLGYVGLPLALAFAKKFKVIGFDINEERIQMMKNNIDPSKELQAKDFENSDIEFTSDYNDLKRAHFHIIGVPTDIDKHRAPNLKPLLSSSESIGKCLKEGDIVVYESTVYPGCTEEDCVPILEKFSGLKYNSDFFVGYSPERINPGDKEHTITKILKIVSGSNDETLEIVDGVYNEILENGTHKASSIKVAEAAKVIENIQRDVNISIINELSIFFDKMDIDTNAVIEAAGSKWNFHKYTPGLVGGHCIGVDPYYLMHKANQLGVDLKVIPAGRRVNNSIPHFIAKRLVQTLIEKGKNPGDCNVLVLGITFKEDVADIRNSKVVDLIKELEEFSLTVDIRDPHASAEEVNHEYGITLSKKDNTKYDSILIAVGHQEYKDLSKEQLEALSKDELVLFDIKGVKNPETFTNYWKL